MIRITVLYTTLLFGAAFAADAGAVEVTRQLFSHAVANCQAALPVFDGNIRKRPKAVANEGTSSAFITCSLGAMPNDLQKIPVVQLFFVNRNTASTSINCTLVNGFQDENFSFAHAKSITIAAGGNGIILWEATPDNAGVNYSFPSTSCNLPPNTEISGFTYALIEDVGA